MKNILLIDADKVTATLTIKFLENYNYNVNWVRSGKEALDQLNDPMIDLIVSDVDLPGLSGFDILKLMKKCFISTPLAFFTSKDDKATKLDARLSGAVALISKRKDFINLPHLVSGLFQLENEIG
ncbi:MAG: response regulator transcription factor [Flavobacteriales bacterium]